MSNNQCQLCKINLDLSWVTLVNVGPGESTDYGILFYEVLSHQVLFVSHEKSTKKFLWYIDEVDKVTNYK